MKILRPQLFWSFFLNFFKDLHRLSYRKTDILRDWNKPKQSYASVLKKGCSCNFCRVVQPQINVETTLCISTLEFTTLNNVESTLRISTLMCATLDNVETRLSFSTSSFTTFVNVETTLWNWPFLNGTKRKSFQIDYTEFKVFLVIT